MLNNAVRSIVYSTSTVGPYPIPFLFYRNEDITVTLDGNLLAQDSDYTIAGAGSQDVAGSVTLLADPTDGLDLKIDRVVDFTQEIGIAEAGPFPAAAVEEALDRCVMQVQQVGTFTELFPSPINLPAGQVVISNGDGSYSAEDILDFIQSAQGVRAGVGMVVGNRLRTDVTNRRRLIFSANSVVVHKHDTNDIKVFEQPADIVNSFFVTGVNGAETPVTANTWGNVHCYYISNGTTLATLVSRFALPGFNTQFTDSTGPILPSGYTYWAYAGEVFVEYIGEDEVPFYIHASYRGDRAILKVPLSVCQTVTESFQIDIPLRSALEVYVTLYHKAGTGSGNSFTLTCSVGVADGVTETWTLIPASPHELDSNFVMPITLPGRQSNDHAFNAMVYGGDLPNEPNGEEMLGYLTGWRSPLVT